jgi:hypothetical protein
VLFEQPFETAVVTGAATMSAQSMNACFDLPYRVALAPID